MQNDLRIYFMHTQMCPPIFCTLKNSGIPFISICKPSTAIASVSDAMTTCGRVFFRPSRRSHQRYERDTENHIGVGSVSFDHAIAG